MVTGGYTSGIPPYTIGTVQVYTSEGPQEQLPSLLQRRENHACAYYLDSQDRVVSTAYDITDYQSLCTVLS